MVALLPFQAAGARFLAERPRAILADSMRVGKTPQAAVACDMVEAKRILVVCPAIARPNWLREFDRWTLFSRQGRGIAKASESIDPALTVCSYDLASKPKIFAQLQAAEWDVVIADEFHYLKSLATARSARAFDLLAQAPRAWLLSGTPAPNNASELWPALHKFGITDLSYWDFLKRYCDYWMHPTLGARITGNRTENLPELRALLAPHMLRRTLAEVAPEMPPIRWHEVAVEPGAVGEDLISPELLALAREEEAALAQALDAAQGQIESLDPDECRHYRRLVGLQKVQPVAEIVREQLADGMERIVLFAWHTHVLGALRLALSDFGAMVIDGATSAKQREAAQAAFNAGTCRVLACQIIAAGTAIDLSAADDALFVEQDWTPANNQQAAHRCVSQFKRRPVRVGFVGVANSVDQRVAQVTGGKAQMLAEIFS